MIRRGACANEGFNIRNSIHPGATLTNILKTAIEQAPEVEEACSKCHPSIAWAR